MEACSDWGYLILLTAMVIIGPLLGKWPKDLNGLSGLDGRRNGSQPITFTPR